jgi:hypothetical protein
MPLWIPRSTLGLILAGLYIVVAIVVIATERGESGGGWIKLNGMGAYLITLPVSRLGEILGLRLDFRRNFDMVIAIGVCALLIYFLGAGLAKAASLIFTRTGS